MCKIQFTNANEKLLSVTDVESTKSCIKCLGKPEAAYKLLSTSDFMWFCCALVREEKVLRENITTNKEIQGRWKSFMADYEDKRRKLEIHVAEICNNLEVKKNVTKEIDR
jgi:hypothetical protein